MQSTATPTGTAAENASTPFVVADQARTALEQLVTTRGQLAVSAVLLLVAVVVALVAVPIVFGRIRDVVTSRYLTGSLGDSVALLGEYTPRTPTELVVRTTQLTILVLAALSLLVVWGLVDWAVAVGVAIVDAVPALFKFAATLALVLVAIIGSDQLKRAVRRFSRGADRVTEHQEEIVIRVGQVAWFVTIGATILGIWGFTLSGLLVGAGFLGIVVGFAARQTLGSMIAGFVLMFSRPFTIGDWVEIDDEEGIVTDITIFNTRLENFDGEFVVIPNDRVSDSPVTNRSQKGLLRLRTDVGIDYDADPEEARAVAREAMEEIEEIEANPAPQVIPKAFGDSAIVLELRYWIDHPTPPRKWQAVSAVVRSVKRAFDDHGITIPYPQRELSTRGRVVDGDVADGTLGDANGDGRKESSTATTDDA